MSHVTRMCLHDRSLVVMAWLLLTVVGGLLASSTASRLTYTFATPATASYDANSHILQTLGIDGNEQPTIAILTLAAGQSMHTQTEPARVSRRLVVSHGGWRHAEEDRSRG